jgi:hypothetical protein
LLIVAFSATVSRGVAGSDEVEGVVDDKARFFLRLISLTSIDICESS